MNFACRKIARPNAYECEKVSVMKRSKKTSQDDRKSWASYFCAWIERSSLCPLQAALKLDVTPQTIVGWMSAGSRPTRAGIHRLAPLMQEDLDVLLVVSGHELPNQSSVIESCSKMLSIPLDRLRVFVAAERLREGAA